MRYSPARRRNGAARQLVRTDRERRNAAALCGQRSGWRRRTTAGAEEVSQRKSKISGKGEGGGGVGGGGEGRGSRGLLRWLAADVRADAAERELGVAAAAQRRGGRMPFELERRKRRLCCQWPTRRFLLDKHLTEKQFRFEGKKKKEESQNKRTASGESQLDSHYCFAVSYGLRLEG